MGDFVWHIKCLNTWPGFSENCWKLFWQDFFSFLTFCTYFKVSIMFAHSGQYATSGNAEFDSNSRIINECFSFEVTFCHGRQKKVHKIQILAKNHKSKKSAKNNLLQFTHESDNVGLQLICQTKSPILTDKWLKGF